MDFTKAVQLTEGWNDPVPEELRSKWLHNFWKMESLRGIKFERARMPPDTILPDMDLIAAGDAAEYVKIVGVWGRFRLKSGKFSCQLLIGRLLRATEDATIPKSELDVLMMTSNLMLDCSACIRKVGQILYCYRRQYYFIVLGHQ